MRTTIELTPEHRAKLLELAFHIHQASTGGRCTGREASGGRRQRKPGAMVWLRRTRTTPHQLFCGDEPRRILSSKTLNLGSGRRGSTSGNTLRKGMSGSRSS